MGGATGSQQHVVNDRYRDGKVIILLTICINQLGGFMMWKFLLRLTIL